MDLIQKTPNLPKRTRRSLSISETSKFEDFPYDSGCTCCTVHARLSAAIESYASPRDEYERVLRTYLKDISDEYSDAIDLSIKQIARKLAELNNPSLQQVNDIIVFNLLNNWQENFSEKLKPIIEANIDKAYRRFRKDKSIFRGSKAKVPAAVLNTTDLRTLEYFADIDEIYLGRFITDQDTKRRITKFIRDQHIAGGFTNSNLSAFREEFKEVLQGEDWKIARIIATTTNRMRSAASLNYLQQAEIDTFEIVGINDRLQCPFCRELQGYQFSVERAMTKLDKVLSDDPNIVGQFSPFVTTLFKTADEIKSRTPEQLQDLNIDTPPFHPNCRDRIVAVL